MIPAMGSLGSPTNRADRRRQAKCHHDWKVKEHPDGVGHRWCEKCKREEWHDYIKHVSPWEIERYLSLY